MVFLGRVAPNNRAEANSASCWPTAAPMRSSPRPPPRELRVRRQHVEVVALEHDDAPVLEACARAGGRGLFVVARGAGLDGPRVDRLRQVLRNLGVPMSRSLALSLDAATQRSFVDRVVTVARRIGAPAERRPCRTEAGWHGTSRERRAGDPAGASTAAEPARRRRADTIPPARATAPHVHLGAGPQRVAHADGAVRRDAGHGSARGADLGAQRRAEHRRARAAHRRRRAPARERADDPDRRAAGPATTSPSWRSSRSRAAQVSAQEAALAEDAPAVVDALRKREIRALDVFVVSPEATKAAEFAGAQKYCEKLEDRRYPRLASARDRRAHLDVPRQDGAQGVVLELDQG